MDDCPCCHKPCPVRTQSGRTMVSIETIFICWDCLVSWDDDRIPVPYPAQSAMRGIGLGPIDLSASLT